MFRHALMTMAMLSVELCCGAWQRAAQAQSFPNRPLTMVAPFARGGTTDAIARILAEGLRTELGRRVIFENSEGRAASPAPAGSPKQHTDGYQFVLGSIGTHAQSQSFYKKPLYNAATDFLPVVLVADESIVLVARKDSVRQSAAVHCLCEGQPGETAVRLGPSRRIKSARLPLLNTVIGVNVTHVPLLQRRTGNAGSAGGPDRLSGLRD